MRFDHPTPRLLAGAILLALVLAGPAQAATARKAKPKPAAAPVAPPPPPPAAEAEKPKDGDPKPVTERPVTAGDVIATPVTGAYGHSMGSNYNKVLRPAVVFVSGGVDRLVVRRETVEDLLATDVG